MDIQKEREAFENYCLEVLLMSPSDGHFERELEDPEFYESTDTHRLWKLWQDKAQAVPEGFVLVPKEPSLKVLDRLFMEHLIDEERATYIYKDIIDAQEQNHESK